MVEGHSKTAFKIWLGDRPVAWPSAVEVVKLVGCPGFKTAAVEERLTPVAVMGPSQIVRLGAGRNGDPLYQSERTPHTGHVLRRRGSCKADNSSGWPHPSR